MLKRERPDGGMMKWLAPSFVLISLAMLASPAMAQQGFDTPDAAVDALVAAAKSGDQKEILAILGPEGRAVIDSGDKVADENAKQRFVDAYDAKHEIVREGDGTQTLVIGDDDWPFPLPLVNKDGEWQFYGRARRIVAAPRRPQRARHDPSKPGLRAGAERICRARSGEIRQTRLCAAHREHAWQEGWPLLADQG
jgi:hypothetical protein